eukprot:4092118-Alexandrium_andersonii.AAC.1
MPTWQPRVLALPTCRGRHSVFGPEPLELAWREALELNRFVCQCRPPHHVIAKHALVRVFGFAPQLDSRQARLVLTMRATPCQ